MDPHTPTLEALESRVLLSLTYYDSLRIEELPGFPGGEPGELAGASENGRFLWSRGAGGLGGSPEFLVIDREYHGLSEFAPLDEALISDINSRGEVLATDPSDGRVFLWNLLGGGERRYLDELITQAPGDFDLAEARPRELGDDGIVVLVANGERGEDASDVWALLDGVVHRLWHSERESPAFSVYTADGNVVAGTRYSGRAGREPVSGAVRWTPSGGLAAIEGMDAVAGMNSRGDLLGEYNAPGPPGDIETVVWRDGRITVVDEAMAWGRYGIDDAGRILVGNINFPSSDEIPQIFDGVALVSLYERGGYGDSWTFDLTDSGLAVSRGAISWPVDASEIVHAAADGATVVVDGSGRVIVAFVGRDGRVGTIEKFDSLVEFGAWRRDLPDGAVAITSYVGPRDGRAHSLIEGLLGVYDREQARLVHLEGYAAPGARATSAFVGPGRAASIASLGEDGRLRLVYETPLRSGGDPFWAWRIADLSRDHLGVRGLETPSFAGGLDSFTTPWGGVNIFGVDESGEVRSVWWGPGLGSPLWTTSNISSAAGAPKLVGDVAASATPWGAIQIFGTDERGHAIAIWWTRQTGWRTTDLTALTGGEAVEAGSIAAATTRWGAIELVGRTEVGEVVTYWWTPASPGWTFESISAEQAGETARIVGALSIAVGRDGSQHIAGVSAEGELIHLYWLADGRDLWRAENLTELALT